MRLFVEIGLFSDFLLVYESFDFSSTFCFRSQTVDLAVTKWSFTKKQNLQKCQKLNFEVQELSACYVWRG